MDNLPRPTALLPVDHPLSYIHASKSTTAEPFVVAKTLEQQTTYLYDHRLISDLLNEYTYRIDTCMVDPALVDRWVDLFTDDCKLTYAFGGHVGKKGLGKWAMYAESRFHRMIHLTSNSTIRFESADIAHGRSALFSSSGNEAKEITNNFLGGGYYYWSFRREQGEWKISSLYLDTVWVEGDSKGLNNPKGWEGYEA
ncbi:hypothetical protein LTR93_011687 [Exophiala xenobiotica]|nr:hypothetical protein LTR93_011687 [Exophiala xenobiotica]